MKQRRLASLAVALLIALAASAAFAETAVVNNPDPTDRLNLRESAKAGAPILRKYFNGVEAEILSDVSADWAKVRIGGAEGFMQRKFLATGAAADAVARAIPVGIVDVTPPETKLALRERETDDSAAVGSYDQGTAVLVLGISDGWLYVRVESDGRTGFMRSQWVTQAENLRTAVVSDANKAKTTLRETPKTNGKALGQYDGGVPMVVLFSFEKLEGWTRVRIGDTVGFINNGQLHFNPEPAAQPYSGAQMRAENPGSHINMRKTPDRNGQIVAKLEDGAGVNVLGTSGPWSHVVWMGQYGYIQTSFLR